MRSLTDYLKTIGHENHDTAYMDETGTLRPITKDEQLAREIWRRALGYTEKMVNPDGTPGHRAYAPDPKAQEFIFIRREGKNAVPQDEEDKARILKRVSDVAKQSLNEAAKKIIDDKNDTQPETE